MAREDNKSPITLYDNGCIRSHLVRLMLREKGLAYRKLTMAPDMLSAELLNVNPTRELPMLNVRHDALLFDVLIIADYLDERYPAPSLYLPTAGAKATVKLMLHRFQNVFIPAAYDIINNTKGAPAAKRQLTEALTELAPALNEYRYMLSDDITVLDCFMAALMYRLPELGAGSTSRALKPLRLYLARLFSRPQFKSSI